MRHLRKIPFKIWLFAFSIVLLTVSIMQLPAVGAEEDSDIDPQKIQQYDRDHISLAGAVRKYHTNMNKMFNRYIDKLLDEELDREATAPPQNGDCTEDNVSTYCLSMEAVDEYQAFIEGLKTHEGFYNDKIEDTEAADAETEGYLETLDVIYAESAFDEYAQRISLVDSQRDIALQVMDTALATYNELQVFYALHVEYEGMIEALEAYRDGLADVRKQVEKYPIKFTDRSTTDCT